MQVTTPGNERHVKFAEFAKAAEAEAPEPATPEEEQAMAEYSAEMRNMDAMGETAWLAEQFKPCACGGNCTGETGCTQQPAPLIVNADYADIEARALVLDESHYAKLARHGAAARSGAVPFKGGYVTEVDAAGARKVVGEYREAYNPGAGLFLAAAAALGAVPPASPAMREQARSFDTPKPKDQVRRDVRRKMRKATRQAQRRAGR